MEVFSRVAELGSFVRAAESLRLPRATVTAAVQSLEAQLGLRLLHRTTRRVALTADGAVFHAEIQRILVDLREVEARVRGVARAPGGRVRVDVPAAVGRHVLAPSLPAFLERFPDITIELGTTDRPVDLLGEGVDCVVRGGDVHDTSLRARRLGALPVVTCAAPAYLAARGAPASVADAEGHLFVGFFSPKTGRVFEVDFKGPGGVRAFEPRHRVAANDADTWIAMAVAGLGLVQAPCARQVRAHLIAGRLVRVLPESEVEALPLHVLWPEARPLPSRVRVFVDWVAELYEAECREAAAFLLSQPPGDIAPPMSAR